MRARSIPLVIAALGLVMGPGVAAAQNIDLAVGGGIGVTLSEKLQGTAYHGVVSLPVLELRGPAQLRGELFYQSGGIRGSSFACERVDWFYCLGRSDDNRIAGAAVLVRVISPWIGRFRFYGDPAGVGVYRRVTRSWETQGPTANCFIDGVVKSCPHNPPWATFEYRAARTSVGLNLGGGMQAQLGPARLFAEVRLLRLIEGRGSLAGAMPLSAGMSF